MRRILFALTGLLCIVIGTVFGALNPLSVSVDLWFASVTTTLGLALLCALLLGALVGGLAVAVSVVWPLRVRLSRLVRERVKDSAPARELVPIQPPAAAP